MSGFGVLVPCADGIKTRIWVMRASKIWLRTFPACTALTSAVSGGLLFWLHVLTVFTGNDMRNEGVRGLAPYITSSLQSLDISGEWG